jgi:hypothetical protein
MNCVGFKASNGWLDKFKKRFNIEIRRGRRPGVKNKPKKSSWNRLNVLSTKSELPKRGRPPKVKPFNLPTNDELWPNETVDIRKDAKGKADIYYFNYNVFRS